jgi:hypothetical protein
MFMTDNGIKIKGMGRVNFPLQMGALLPVLLKMMSHMMEGLLMLKRMCMKMIQIKVDSLLMES